MAEKLYYSMGEVAEMFDVRPSLLRHWESQFAVLRPKRNKKGNRLFTPQDVENLKLIYHLVKERGMTLDGARKALRSRRADKGVSRDAELMERLQRIRALLLEVREDLKADEGEVVAVADDFAAEEPSVTPVAAETPVPSEPVAAEVPAETDGGRAPESCPEGRRPRRGKCRCGACGGNRGSRHGSRRANRFGAHGFGSYGFGCLGCGWPGFGDSGHRGA